MKAREMMSSIPADPAAILLTQIHLTMSIGSHQCILAGNLTGLSKTMNAADAAREPSCSGTPKSIGITSMPLEKK